jgi:hypothetical protein
VFFSSSDVSGRCFHGSRNFVAGGNKNVTVERKTKRRDSREANEKRGRREKNGKNVIVERQTEKVTENVMSL